MNPTVVNSPDQIERKKQRQRLRYQLQRACRLDPGIGGLIGRIGYPEPRIHQPGFETLLQIIISQQVSTQSAAAIQRKLARSCQGRVTWRKVLNRGEDGLRQCGFSRQKIDYALGLAGMLKVGELDLDSLQDMDTGQVIDELIRVKGFGRWSCQIYAMFALGHRDVYPEDDLGLQLGIQRYLTLTDKPGARETAAIADRWAPYRSAVSLLMWKYYGSTTLEGA